MSQFAPDFVARLNIWPARYMLGHWDNTTTSDWKDVMEETGRRSEVGREEIEERRREGEEV